ncbi:aldose 1-epimerase family protein [Antrihabitans cavernicola]|uniref:Aldose 1-epimerase family protein n=1 Tax=Antrihabitans cavernicola TaxID=2495913 RepID=A0A5A7S4U7_9NOCA|nr:aldose 1-epimerase family protein [Spelaeibacter cavernicola]KAA0021200.1 aldose 1-epimerase family protein [Spelaeibacter cavernicola]
MTEPVVRHETDGTSTARTFQIQFGDYRAEVVSTGAGLRMLERTIDGAAYPLTESWPAGTKPPLSAGLVLAPWSNRIRDGHFDFDGIDHQLEITEPARNNAIHGLVRRRDWRLEEHQSARVKQSIDVGLHKGWPYPMRLSVTHEVGDDGLTVTHTATNTGVVPAPFGLGIHSFVRAGNVPLDDCTLQLTAGVWQPMEPERMLPVGPCLPVWNSRYDFTKPQPLKGQWLDTPFGSIVADPDGKARHILRAPDGTGTVLWTGREFNWIQVFTADPEHDQGYPDRGRALAIEPMTCPPNAFNSGIDEIVLEPGQTWSAKWGMATL